MKRRIDIKKYLAVGLGVGAMTLGASMANAAPVSLCAGATTVTMPDGAVVPMWGFAPGGATAGLCDNPVTVPGPELVSTALDPNLEVTLSNTLPVPVSLIITGQKLPAGAAPVYNDPLAVGRNKRVRSLVQEAAPGGSNVYTWLGLNPGSHIYHSATHQQVQVQMGLYGAMTQDVDVNTAYTGVAYDNSVNMFYSEIDPVLHTSVENGCFTGIPANPSHPPDPCVAMTSTWAYAPKYALVNGYPSDGSAPIAAGQAGQNILVRMFNAGLQTHMPATLGVRMNLVAENGYTLPYAKSQQAVALHAMMTADVMINTTTVGNYPLYDRRLNLSDGTTNMGMMSRLAIAAAGGGGVGAAPNATANGLTTDEDTLGAVNVAIDDIADTSVNPLNAIDIASVVIVTAAVHGVATVDPLGDGNVTYQPDPNYNGPDQFTYTVSDTDGLTSSPALVSVTVTPVNDLPVALDDTYSTEAGVLLNVAAPGVLANDNDAADGGTVSAVVQTAALTSMGGTVTLNADGSFDYNPGAVAAGSVDSFSYQAIDADLATTTATVTIDVTALIPVAPVAADDVASTAEDTAAVIDVLLNDSAGTSPFGAINIVSAPSHGNAVVTAGTIQYTPTTNYAGADSFTYTVSNTDVPALTSNVATVSITVTPVNDAPIGNADAYSIPTYAGVTLIPAASGVLANDVDYENDALTAGTLDVAGTAGTVVLYLDGSFAYTPSATAADGDVDTFTYMANDGAANSAATTVTINLVGAPPTENAPPEAQGDRITYSRGANGNLPMNFPMSALTANDTDPDGTIVSIQLVDGNNDLVPDTRLNGSSISFDAVTQTLTYTPVAGTSTRNDRFWYQAIDDRGGVSGEATVVIRVTN